jgi:AcrR family transcriptional regulator
VARALPSAPPASGSDDTAAAGGAPVIRAVPTPSGPLPDTTPTAVDAAAGPAAPPSSPAPEPTVERPAGPRRGRGTGARERKRQETRARIVDAAAELFAERGFDTVSVLEVARRAGVVEKTVFNHFPVKEGLVFESDPPMRAALLDAVRTRPAGESVAAAAGTFVVAAVSLLGTPEAADGVAAMARVIRAELTDALAGLIAEETRARPGTLEPWLAAHAVMGLYAGLLELARDRVLDGVSGRELAVELRTRGERGLALLQFGLAGYAKRR